MTCRYQDLEWRLYLKVRCGGKVNGPLHHGPHYFPYSPSLICAQYDDVLGFPTQNMLAYHMLWWQSLGSYFFLSSCLALGLSSDVRICYNMNWITKTFPLLSQKIIRRPPSLPMLCSFFGLILSDSYIPYLLDDCELSRQCLKTWGLLWGLGSASEICHVIHPWLDNSF